MILIGGILFLPKGLLGRFVRSAQGRGRATVAAGARTGMTATDVPPSPPTKSDAPTGATLLEVRGLAKSFKGLRALDGVDLDVRRGEILGLVGPNGSGKSTLINVVSGHYRCDGGSIVFAGRDLARQ